MAKDTQKKKPKGWVIAVAVIIALAIIQEYPWILILAAVACIAVVGVRHWKKRKAMQTTTPMSDTTRTATPIATKPAVTVAEPKVSPHTIPTEERDFLGRGSVSAAEEIASPAIEEQKTAVQIVQPAPKEEQKPVAQIAPPAPEKEQKATAQDISHSPESAERPTTRITPYTLKGVFKCEKAIFHDLMEENPAYEFTKRELIDDAMTDYPVYKWVPAMLPARLAPEPDNPYDKNAIRVYVGETMIGYIPKGKCLEVQKIIDEDRLLNVAYEITGGKYKLVSEDYDPSTDKSKYTMESGYEEVAAKVYIKEQL